MGRSLLTFVVIVLISSIVCALVIAVTASVLWHALGG